jgi:hypothetical protein
MHAGGGLLRIEPHHQALADLVGERLRPEAVAQHPHGAIGLARTHRLGSQQPQPALG